jgi:hypothetical protein
MNLNDTLSDYWQRLRILSIKSFSIRGVDECGFLLVCYLAHTVNSFTVEEKRLRNYKMASVYMSRNSETF